MKKIFVIIALISPLLSFAQEQTSGDDQEVGNKEYVIVKDYKPVLAESNKISETPSGDTSTFNIPSLQYPFTSRRAELPYETASINAVKIKDEPIQKLYRCYLKTGAGNYSKYLGELYINSLRSKKGDLGLSLKHLSAVPSFKDYNPAGYSSNTGNVHGSYFLNHARLTGDVNYDRQVVHYYGIKNEKKKLLEDDSKQVFSNINANVGIASMYTDSAHLNYKGGFSYADLKDNYGVDESEIMMNAGADKKWGAMTYGMNVLLDFFQKSAADTQQLSLHTNLSRNIIRVNPYLASNRGKINFKGGLRIESETNEETTPRVFPQLDIKVPVAEGVLSMFVSVDGGIDKNNYHTVSLENPFVNPAVTFKNTIRMADIKGGLTARFSNAFSVAGSVGYINYRDLQYYVNDTISANVFNLKYDDAQRFNLHGELTYRSNEKLGVSLMFDQYSYKMKYQEKAWYRPSTVVTLRADYNLGDKLLLKAALFGVGTRYALQQIDYTKSETRTLKPYLDANLGAEYRYSKLLSVFFNFNNIGCSQFRQWYDYRVESLNFIGGITYAF